MSFDLSSKKISKTFQHILQQRGDDNKLYDLQGNEIGDLKISGSLIANQYTVSSSVTNVTFLQQSGSTIFGDSSDDTHQFTGSLTVTGSGDHYIVGGDVGIGTTSPNNKLEVQGDAFITGFISGSATSTGSFGKLKTIDRLDFDTNVASTIRIPSKTGAGNVDGANLILLAADALDSEGGNANVGGNIILQPGDKSSGGTDGKVVIADGHSISGSGTSTGSYGHLMLDGGNFTSASLASAIAGGDNLGSHIATQALNLDSNTITNTSHITPDEDITKDLGSASLRFRTLYASETQIGGVFETGLRTKDIDNFETGTVVVWSKDGLTPCVNAYDNLVMGVIKKGRDVPIVLGAEPVLLTGKVKLGEYIVTSKKLGHGMAISEKLFFNKNLFGKVIGQALEDAEGESVLVKCMVRKI